MTFSRNTTTAPSTSTSPPTETASATTTYTIDSYTMTVMEGGSAVATVTDAMTITNASDFASYTHYLATVSAASTSASNTSTASTPPVTPQPASATGASASLSPAAKAGTGVGVGVGVSALLIWTIAWLLVSYVRRRSRRRRSGVIASPFEKAELDNKDLPRAHGRSELEVVQPVEMDATGAIIKEHAGEMIGSDVPELKAANSGDDEETGKVLEVGTRPVEDKEGRHDGKRLADGSR